MIDLAPGPRRRIVVIDDDVTIGMTLSIALPEAEIIDVSRRGLGLVLVRQVRPDAVIVDRRFPDGDGLALVRTLRDEDPAHELVIIVLTAGFDEADRAAVEAQGADAYLAKTIDPDELLAVVNQLIGDRPPIDRSMSSAPRDVIHLEDSRHVRTEINVDIDIDVDVPQPALAAAASTAPRGEPLRVDPKPAPESADITRLDAALRDALDDNARLAKIAAGLESDLENAIAASQRAVTDGQHLGVAADRLQAELARTEADAQLLREQLVAARADLAEVDQLRRELGQAYAEIDRLERTKPPAARTTPRKAPAKAAAKKATPAKATAPRKPTKPAKKRAS